MHLRIYPVFAALVIGLHAFSQPYFSKTYQGLPLVRGTITPDSGLVLCGGGGSSSYTDYAGKWLLRVDREGTPLWTTAYTASQAEPVWIRDVASIGDSSYILVGWAGAEWTPSNKLVQQVLGSTGEVLWGGKANGDGFDDSAYRLNRAECAPDGSVIVCGVRLTMNLGGVSGPGYATRIGEDEGSYFTPFTSYPSGGPLYIAVIEDVAATSDGGFVCLGYAGNYIVAYKVNPLGTVAWSRSLYNVGVDNLLMHIAEGENGSSYAVIQAFSGTFRLLQLDSIGDVSWSKAFQMPGEDKPTGLVRFPNGDLWISGTSWLMACSSVGDVLWARSMPHVIVDMEGAPEANGVFLIGREGNDGWLMRTDSTGQVSGCSGSSFVPPMTSLTLVSQSYPPPLANTGLSAYETGVTVGQSPLTQTDCLVTAIGSTWSSDQPLRAYPVPFTHVLNVELPASHDRVELIDAQGVIKRSLSTNNERSIVLHREDLPPGIYMVRVMKEHALVAAQRVVAE